MTSSELSMIVDRQRELGRALHQLEVVQRERRLGVVLVRGPGGIGKTALARQLQTVAGEQGSLVLTGRADDFDRAVPYGLFRDMAARAAAVAIPAGAATALTQLRRALATTGTPAGLTGPAAAESSSGTPRPLPALAALLSEVSASPASARTAGERAGGTAEMSVGVSVGSERSPAVVTLEDLHVADPDSLAVLGQVVRQVPDAAVLLVLTLRTGYPVATEIERYVERSVEDGTGAVIDLGPLSRNGIGRLMTQVLRAEPSDELVAEVVEASRGNPFFAQEMTRGLLSEVAVSVTDGHAELVDAAAPVSFVPVGGGLLRRFFRASSDEARVAQALAVLGRVQLGHLPVVEELTGLSEAWLVACFDRLVGQRLLVREGHHGFGFAHPILRDALYAELGDAGRRELHRSVADVLTLRRAAGQAVDVFELAGHAVAGGDVGDTRGVALALEAADLAMAGAPLVAAHWYAQALLLMGPDDASRPDVLAHQVYALLIGAETGRAVELALDALRHLQPSASRTDLAFTSASVLFAGEELEEALRIVDEEVAAGAVRSSLLTLRVNLLAQLGRAEEARVAYDQVLAAPWPVEPPTETVSSHVQLLCYATLTGSTAAARGHEGRARGLLVPVPVSVRREFVHLLGLSAVQGPGTVHDAHRYLNHARQLSVGGAGRGAGGTAELAELTMAWLRGDWEPAVVAAFDVAPALEAIGSRTVLRALWAIVGLIQADRGDREGTELATRDLAPGVAASWPFVATARARAHRLAGRPDRAREVLRGFVQQAERTGYTMMHTLVTEEWADLEREQGNRAEAAWIARAGVAHVAQLAWPLLDLFGQRSLAAATGDIRAATRAARIAEENAALVELAKCRLVLGELGVAPQTNLPLAWERFLEVGATPWRARTAAALRQHGLAVPRSRAHSGGLSQVELDVARLVASGASNRDIAARLHYSPKTVETYLSRIYAKTGCASRVELTRAVLAGQFGPAATVLEPATDR